MTFPDPKEVVRRGYNEISYLYRADDATDAQYAAWLAELQGRIPGDSAVLDIGCGCGVPMARSLAEAGHKVTGIDLSEVQIQRARELVPRATFIHTDATAANFPAESFDAVVCLYALIHMPLDEQPELLSRIASWLRPGGWFLATTGHRAWTGTDDDWLGGTSTMWWSHADSATYRTWITQAGFKVISEKFVPEGTSGHTLFWARRRYAE